MPEQRSWWPWCRWAPGALAETPRPQTLTAEGRGSVMITPDVASLTVSVSRSAPTSAPALSATNRTVRAIVTAVRGVGVPASAIQTESVHTSCSRVRVGAKGHKRLIVRCSSSQSVSITSGASTAGRVTVAATGAVASNIDGPNFTFANPSAGEIPAEKAAITDARHQAKAAAAQLGCVITGGQSIDLTPQSSASASAGSTAAPSTGGPSTPTTVRPGRQEVDATVAVVFTIAPAGPAS